MFFFLPANASEPSSAGHFITFRHAATSVNHFFSCQVKNAVLAGAKGIIMFSDPADYSAAGVKVGHCVRKGGVSLSMLDKL